MTMHEQWVDQLSDYLDGELSAADRDAVRQHLEGCGDCAAVLDDLRRVVARAGALPARPPRSDLWRGVAARLEPGRTGATRPAGRRPRRFAFSLPQLAAAAVVLVAASGTVAWRIAERNAAEPAAPTAAAVVRATGRPAAPADVAPPPEPVPAAAVAVDAQYDAAVGDLERALKDGRGRLDASTVAIVERNLQIIDQAIAQARAALAADPADTYLSDHLIETQRHKLDLLRRAAALAEETN